MKKIALMSAIIFFLFSCKNRSGEERNKIDYMNIITVTDGGKTYGDTISYMHGGIVVATESKPPYNDAVISKENDNDRIKTVADNNNYYSATCSLHKNANGAVFNLKYAYWSPSFPVSLTINNAHEVEKGTGIYKVSTPYQPQQTSTNTVKDYNAVSGGTYIEAFSGGKKYDVDSAVVNIQKATGNNIIGTYQLWLTSADGTKTVNGTINWNN